MLSKTQDKRMRIRYVKKVTKIPALIEYRLALQKWSKFVVYERNLQEKVERSKQYFNDKRIATALNKMIEHHEISQEKRERNKRITQFYFEKQAVQIFDMFRVFLDIQREKRFKLETALNFRTSKLSNKAFKSWKKYMSDNYELFVKKKALTKHLKVRNCPRGLSQWIEYAAKHKVYRLKSEKATQ
jgi:hypothetical protein